MSGVSTGGMLSSTRLPRSSIAAGATDDAATMTIVTITFVRRYFRFHAAMLPQAMNAVMPRLTKFADGITAVDTEYVRPQMDASHIVVSGGRAAIVDTGPNTAVPLILAALDRARRVPDAVDWLFLTHVHLDHAGGAGALMRALPNATASCIRAARRTWSIPPSSSPAPAPSTATSCTRNSTARYCRSRPTGCVIAQDGERFDLPGRGFECVHTPGHALHHQAIVDHDMHAIFTGDTFGHLVPRVRHRARPVDHAHHDAHAIRSRDSSRPPSSGSCSSGRANSTSRITARWATARGSPTTWSTRSTSTWSSRAPAGCDQGRMRFELRTLGARKPARSRLHADRGAGRRILRKDFELNAAGLAAWLQARGPLDNDLSGTEVAAHRQRRAVPRQHHHRRILEGARGPHRATCAPARRRSTESSRATGCSRMPGVLLIIVTGRRGRAARGTSRCSARGGSPWSSCCSASRACVFSSVVAPLQKKLLANVRAGIAGELGPGRLRKSCPARWTELGPRGHGRAAHRRVPDGDQTDLIVLATRTVSTCSDQSR